MGTGLKPQEETEAATHAAKHEKVQSASISNDASHNNSRQLVTLTNSSRPRFEQQERTHWASISKDAGHQQQLEQRRDNGAE